ncbi:uncharacterized protein LTR77_006763 [Saxophila tyrrhenica]|uniref:Interferon-related developmental regulator N-terminal domain-containing protein n=1 Tax=Saxophila tyrrhenica TaxID=1690608 RepID=A0AAV9P5Q4_9PEZI|nr:hypothetical protein LTR77_006763 [Saxophila tyrrhenica]
MNRRELLAGKTVSRKAKSRTSTPNASRQVSRANTPYHSDDEADMSDTTQWSTNSIDDLIASAEDDKTPDAWTAFLDEKMNEICDRKRSSVQGREDSLQAFIAGLTRHYGKQEIKRKMGELVPSLLKSVKSGQTERETVLALKALALMLVTDPSEDFYDTVSGPVKTVVTDAQHPTAKIAAMHVLSVATFYGGASMEEVESIMDFFLEIASSDGSSIEEADNAEVVVTALEEWGFLATQLEDLEESTEVAMDTFVDQLESGDAGVLTAAGDNIALLYEKSYTEAESDDEVEEGENENQLFADGNANNGNRDVMIKRYTVYRQKHRLEQQLAELAKASSKRLSKKDRKSLHMTFTDILHTVEKPTRGPRYSTALDEDGYEMGSRLKINVQNGGKMTIDKWWKLHRLNALKRLLQSGFLEHYENNQVVFDTLPVEVEGE